MVKKTSSPKWLFACVINEVYNRCLPLYLFSCLISRRQFAGRNWQACRHLLFAPSSWHSISYCRHFLFPKIILLSVPNQLASASTLQLVFQVCQGYFFPFFFLSLSSSLTLTISKSVVILKNSIGQKLVSLELKKTY